MLVLSAPLALLLASTLSLLIPSSVLAAHSSALPHVSIVAAGGTANAEAGQAGSTVAAPAQKHNEDEDDRAINLAQPDYTIINLPTALRVPRFKSAFRVTHRFGRPLGDGSFGDLIGDLFGIDSGAQIGLEYRFGILRGTQVGIYRTSDKTIEFFGQYNALRQGDSPVTLDALVTVEGRNNFRDTYSPAIGAIVARSVGTRAAFYLEPIWIGNANVSEPTMASNYTLLGGLGARVRVRPTVYLVGEWAPRISGYAPRADHKAFAIEKRAGGHVFQLNFSNSLNSGVAPIARGARSNADWYLGFNISRKFF